MLNVNKLPVFRYSLAAATAMALLLTVALDAHAQTVDLGGTGAYGPMIITTDTEIPLPEDGVFHVTRLEVAEGATLTFGKNARNTAVTIIATEDVVIDGTISVAGKPGVIGAGGKGGPGGFDGGDPGIGDLPTPRYHSPGMCFYNPYKSSCRPIIGNNGGDGSLLGQHYDSQTCTLGGGGGGGGGAIWIASHKEVRGSGTISAKGGQAMNLQSVCGTSLGNVPQNGADGLIFISTPTIYLENLSLLAERFELHAMTINGSLAPGNPILRHHHSLMAWTPDIDIDASIIAVNGVPVPEGQDYTVTTSSGTALITVEARGCDKGKVLLELRHKASNHHTYSYKSTHYLDPHLGIVYAINNPTLVEQHTFSVTTPSVGQITEWRAFAYCYL